MNERFNDVGTVRKVRPGDGHVVAEVPGKIALVMVDPYAGERLGYFSRERRPKVGARIGARGDDVVVDVPPEAIAPEDRELARLGKPIQFQVDVTEWTVVSDDDDPLFDD